MGPDKAENTENSYILGQLHVTVLLPPAIALLWSCLEHRIGPSILGFPWEDAQPPVLPCPAFSSTAVVRWMRGWMCALLRSRFFLTFPPSGKSSIKARGHHPSHRWGGSDCRFQACPSHKGMNWDLFLKAHNQPSLGSSSQKSERSVGATEGMMLYRPRVRQQHFPLDHQAGGGIEKPMRLK